MRIDDIQRLLASDPSNSILTQRYLSACDRARVGISTEVRNRLLLVAHQARVPENLRDILEQYEGNLRRLTSYGIVTVPEDPNLLPFITGIDGKQYPVPTFEQVIIHLSEEDKRVIKTIDHPKLLLSPFAKSLEEFGQQITGQTGSLPDQNLLYTTWDQNADVTGDLLYNVKGFKGKIEGMMKSQILALPTDKNPFPGWRVMVVDGKPEINRQTIKKEGGGSKNAHDFLEEYQNKGWDGLTPEDWLALHMLAMETGTPFERQNWCWLLGSYLKSARAVPDAYWLDGVDQVDLREFDPEFAWYYQGSRAARRLGLGR